MTYEEIVAKVKEAYSTADATSINEHVAIQFNIEGEGEGAFYLEITDGKIDVQPFEYYDKDATVYTTAETLQEIAEDKLNVVMAFTIGKIRVEGDLGKAALLQDVEFKAVEVKAEEKAPAKKAAKAPAKKTTKKTTKKTK